MSIIEHIKAFITLSPELEQSVRAILHEEKFRKGELMSGINLTTYSFFIVSGAARIFYTLRGKEHTISFAFPGESVVIPRYAVRNYPDTLTIQFLEPTVVNRVPHVGMRSIMEDSGMAVETPGLLLMNAALLQYVSFLEERVHVMQSLSARERFQWLINRYPRIMECANLSQIASYLGLTKETLYRIRSGSYPSHS